MKKQVTLGLTAALAAAVLLPTVANAHSPYEVRQMLRDHGYYRINFTDRVLPTYQLNACKRNKRFHLHVNYYGDITRRERIGWCGFARKRLRWRYVH